MATELTTAPGLSGADELRNFQAPPPSGADELRDFTVSPEYLAEQEDIANFKGRGLAGATWAVKTPAELQDEIKKLKYYESQRYDELQKQLEEANAEEIRKYGKAAQNRPKYKPGSATPEQIRRTLKSISSHPMGSYMEAGFSPIASAVKEIEESETPGKAQTTWSKIAAGARGLRKGVGALVRGTSGTEPIMSDELEKLGVVEKHPTKDLYRINLAKYPHTYSPVSESIVASAQNLLNAVDRPEDPQALQEIINIANLRGSQAKKDVTPGRQAKELLDTMFGNIKSSLDFANALKKSSLLRRPDGMTMLPAHKQIEAQQKIDEARRTNKTIEWEDPEIGIINVDPVTTMNSINDSIFAQKMTEQVAHIADTAQSGGIKDIGNVLSMVLSGGFTEGVAAGAAKLGMKRLIPKIVAGGLRSVPKTAAALGKAGTIGADIAIQKYATEAGTIGSEAEKRQSGNVAGIAAGLLHGGALGIKKAFKVSGKTIENIANRLDAERKGRADKVIDAYRNSNSWHDLPPELQKDTPIEKYDTVKGWISGTDKAINDLNLEADNYIKESGINPRAWEGFKALMQDKQNPIARRLIENLNAAEAFHTGRTLEEARVESAFMATIAEPNVAAERKEIEAPLAAPAAIGSTTGEVNLGHQGTRLDQYRDLFSNPEALVAAVKRDYPEFGNAFEAKLKLDVYQPEWFYFYRAKDLLNNPLTINRDNIHAVNAAFGGTQPTIAALAKKSTMSKQEPVGIEIATLKSDLNNLQVVSQNRAALIQQQITDIVKGGKVSAKDAGFLKEFAKDVNEGRPVSKQYVKHAADIVKTVQNPGSFLTNVKDYRDLQGDIGRHTVALGEVMSSNENLNPQEFMRRRAEYITNDNDRNAYGFTTSNPKDNMMYAINSFFKGANVDPQIAPHLRTALFDKLPNRKSVELEIDALSVLIANKTTPLDPTQLSGARTLRKVLMSYERDIKHYRTGMDAINDRSVSVTQLLTSLRNNLDQIRNPALAAELNGQMQALKPKFFQFFADRNADLSLPEQQSLWNYMTGDAFVRLKEGQLHFATLNYTTMDSMIKGLNALGRDTLNAYSVVFQAAHDMPLDKDVFHGFFCTPVNGFDSNNMFAKGNLLKALQNKKEVMDAARNEITRFMISARSYDEMEAQLARTLHLAPGPAMSYFVNDSRRAKKLIQDMWMGKDNDFGIPVMNINGELRKLKSFAYLENPVLVDMIKKSFVVQGYEQGMNIAKFKEDGSYESTKFGMFADRVYNDPQLMQVLHDLSSGKVPGGVKSMVNPLADIAIRDGHATGDPIHKNGQMTDAQHFAEYLLGYWDFFGSKNATAMWKNMREFHAFYGKVDAYLLKADKVITAVQNAIYSKMGDTQAIPKVHREHRINNALLYKGNELYNHPFGSGYQELRINHMFGTSERAFQEMADDYTLKNTKHPLDNLYAKVWSSVMSSNTAHARSALEAYAVGARHLGFDLYSDWVARASGLMTDSDVAIENAQLGSVFRAIRVMNMPVFSALAASTNDLVTSAVRPFGTLFSFSSVTKNNAQASVFSFSTSNKTWGKLVNTMTSPLKVVIMSPFYNREGMARGWYRKAVVTDARMWEIGNAVVKGYHDTQYKNAMGASMEYAKMGKLYGAGRMADFGIAASEAQGALRKGAAVFDKGVMTFTEQSLNAMDAFNGWVAANTKERSELYHSRTVINQGLVVAQGVIRALESGDEAGAYRLISDSFMDRPAPIAEWHLNNFKKNLVAGDAREALWGFLPAYADQNTGRFGRLVQPEYVKKVSKIVPGVGLFYSASNLWTWKFLQNIGGVMDKNSLERAKFGMSLVTLAGFSAMWAAYFNVISNGLPTPLADAVLTDADKQKAADTGDEWSVRKIVLNAMVNGIVPGADLSAFAGVDWSSMKPEFGYDKEGGVEFSWSVPSNALFYVKQVEDLLGFGSGRGDTGFKLPILGYAWEKTKTLPEKIWQAWNFYHEIPDHKLGDPGEAVNYENMLNLKDGQQELLEAWTTNPKDPETLAKLEALYAEKRALSLGRVWDKLFQIGPLNFTSDILANSFTTYLAFKTIRQELQKDGANIAVKDVLQLMSQTGTLMNENDVDPMTQKGVIAPFSQAQNLSPFPLRPLMAMLYKELGFDALVDGNTEYEAYLNFVDGIAAMMVKKKIWDPKYAERLSKANVKQSDLLFGLSKQKAADDSVLSDTPVNMDTSRLATEQLLSPR